jgi:hypothetical protein
MVNPDGTATDAPCALCVTSTNTSPRVSPIIDFMNLQINSLAIEPSLVLWRDSLDLTGTIAGNRPEQASIHFVQQHLRG